MPAPDILNWEEREVIVPDKMNSQIRDMQAYFANRPWFHIMMPDQDPKDCQTFPEGVDQLYIKWPGPGRQQGGWRINDDRTGFIVPEDGTYYFYANAGAAPLKGPSPVNIPVIYLTIVKNGTDFSSTAVSCPMQNEVTTTHGVLVECKKGDVLQAEIFVADIGAGNTFRIENQGQLCTFGAFKVSEGDLTKPCEPAPGLKRDWQENAYIDTALWQEQTTGVNKALLGMPRFQVRGMVKKDYPQDSLSPVEWNTDAVRQCGGWKWNDDAYSIIVPETGIYLISSHSSLNAPNTDLRCNFNYYLHLNDAPVALSQGGAHRKNYLHSRSIQDFRRLQQGDRISFQAKLAGGPKGAKWLSGDDVAMGSVNIFMISPEESFTDVT
ncbi:hypothetical protein [Streptomyces sp. 769]|uniref:hypothetical protein n=1 Tax=Streptomyces sp. 769 TaxID=1262452 RepID=UPI0005801772|nr:hypothetical protein [Streptomyces sp. 769]AJC54007.1 hypothetical protein GZL_01407 [Streptomyces sp. 769]